MIFLILLKVEGSRVGNEKKYKVALISDLILLVLQNLNSVINLVLRPHRLVAKDAGFSFQ